MKAGFSGYRRSTASVSLPHWSPLCCKASKICSIVSKQKQELIASMCASGPVLVGLTCTCISGLQVTLMVSTLN